MTQSTDGSDLTERSSPWVSLAVCLGLVLITTLAFFGVWKNEFIDYDDNTYVFRNPSVIHGVNWKTTEWAFTAVHGCNWHPLTWLTHALDCQIYGLNPAGHHVTNLLLHAVNVVLVFLALRLMTGSLWRSALVAALFGVHPLRVESVAWVAERKDVLSGLFFVLTLISYTKFVESRKGRPLSITVANLFSRHYALTLLFFACGLMSKPMLVTIPFVLLLLDFWPYQRFIWTDAQRSWEQLKQLTFEKAPFFLLTFASCLITLRAQDTAFMSIDSLPLDQRIGNALQVYVAYLQQMLWPDNLAVYYPKPALIFGIGALGALLILAVITFATVRVAKTAPYAVVCWFCYLGILVPVIGIVQVGSQAQADRYTYLPSIFISILVVWGLSVFVRGKASRVTGLCVAGAVITMLMLATRRQVVIWQNTETLFTHAARVTRDNPVALATLADIDLSRGRVAEATATVERILKIAPGFPRAECLKAAILQRQGRMQEAIPHLERSTGPEVFVAGRARLVLSLIDVGRLPEAEAVLNQVLQMMPNNPDAWLMKAALLREQGHTAEAVELFKKITAAYSPKLQDTPLLNYEIAELFSLTGQNKKAVEFYARAIADFPDFINALNNFAWLLATDLVAEMRNGKLAVQYAERACELAQWKQPVFMGTLAAAYAEADRFDDAMKMAERARDKAKATGNNAVANRNAELLELYRQGKPFREVSN